MKTYRASEIVFVLLVVLSMFIWFWLGDYNRKESKAARHYQELIEEDKTIAKRIHERSVEMGHTGSYDSPVGPDKVGADSEVMQLNTRRAEIRDELSAIEEVYPNLKGPRRR